MHSYKRDTPSPTEWHRNSNIFLFHFLAFWFTYYPGYLPISPCHFYVSFCIKVFIYMFAVFSVCFVWFLFFYFRFYYLYGYCDACAFCFCYSAILLFGSSALLLFCSCSFVCCLVALFFFPQSLCVLEFSCYSGILSLCAAMISWYPHFFRLNELMIIRISL